MTAATMPRPIAPAPRLDAIPAELTSRPQWVNWRYELGDNGKWTKRLYTPGTTRKASHSRPSHWRSYAEAVCTYQTRPDFFDGIGYVFAADDPYVGGDIDHSLDTDRLPPTYAEISPSGNGIKFIARASGNYGRNTKRGELYSSKRFFTMTGNVLPGHESITECQESVEAFAASLGFGKCSSRKAGSAGTGARADIAAQIPDAIWEEARTLKRTQRESLLRRVKAAGGRDTQLALVLAEQYAEFHRRWAFVGLFREDGSLDGSQVRAVAAYGIKGRGFTFPEYAAIMGILYGSDMVAKWGAGEAVRMELAALWQKAPGPKFAPRAKKAPRVARGRAGDHTALVEQVYSLLVEHKAGAEAIVTARQISDVIYCARETVARIIAELVASGRIRTRRLPRHDGLVITFLDVIYSPAAEAVYPQPAQSNDDRSAAAEETPEYSHCVSSDREADHSSAPPSLAELAREYLSRPAPRVENALVDRSTGEIKTYSKPDKPAYRRTAKHFAGLVTADYGDHYTADQARAAYEAEKQYIADLTAQEWRRLFKVFKAMTADELITFIRSGILTDTAELDYVHVIRDKHYFKTRMDCAKRELKWRGLTMPKRVTNAQQQAQYDAAAVAEKARRRAEQQQLLQRLRVPQVAADPAFRDIARLNRAKPRAQLRVDALPEYRDEDNL